MNKGDVLRLLRSLILDSIVCHTDDPPDDEMLQLVDAKVLIKRIEERLREEHT